MSSGSQATTEALTAEEEPRANEAQPRVVYTQPPITLGVVVGREGSQYRVRIGTNETLMAADSHVAPALLEEAIEDGRRVVVDPSSRAICGLLQTTRTLSIDRHGDVNADVRRFEVRAEQDALLRAAGSFLHLDDDRAELFAKEAVVRARGALRALARLIKLN